MLYLANYREQNGKMEQLATPCMKNAGLAFRWLIERKPFVLSNVQEVTIEPYRQLAVRK